MSKECFECGKDAAEDHHVIPQSLGGTKTIPLCGGCHALVHGGYNKRRDDHVALTKAGLQRARERGVRLGNWTNIEEAQAKGLEGIQKASNEFALKMAEYLLPMQTAGLTLQEMADKLNTDEVKTMRSGKWHTTSVRNVLKRLKRLQTSSSGSTQIELSTPHPEESSLPEH